MLLAGAQGLAMHTAVKVAPFGRLAGLIGHLRLRRIGASRLTARLSIVKHLVIAMHGEVYVTDNPTGGAIFRVTLPAAPVRDAMGGADDQTNGLASASAP